MRVIQQVEDGGQIEGRKRGVKNSGMEKETQTRRQKEDKT